jgi:hypothetical protein
MSIVLTAARMHRRRIFGAFTRKWMIGPRVVDETVGARPPPKAGREVDIEKRTTVKVGNAT